MSTTLLRRILVTLLCLMPLLTLIHRNDLGRWEFNRCAMAAPDELSYLLMAKSIALHGTISTTALAGRDTFYPPGYPAILAAWGKAFGFSIESMHVCTALLLCAAAGLGYLLVTRILDAKLDTSSSSSSFIVHRSSFPVLILALFVCNWHVLEGALFIFSEPAFMLVTFAWLLLGLTWRQWYRIWWQALVMALLAAAAISIRGAGLVCFATLLLYALVGLIRHWRIIRAQREIAPRLACIMIVLAVAVAYQAALHYVSPEKGLAAGHQSANSYTKQLLHGFTDGGNLDIHRRADWPPLLQNAGLLVANHFDDFSQSFTPIFREDPLGAGLLNVIGKFVLVLAGVGWLWRMMARGKSALENSAMGEVEGLRTRFLEWYVGLYIGLYLIWPFNMPRFWTPLLPVMLAYAVVAMKEFGTKNSELRIVNSESTAGRLSKRPPFSLFTIPHSLFLLLSLLLVLYVEEVAIQWPHYQRRLNYVSDALAQGARRIVQLSPDPALTTVCVLGGDEHFVFAWYLPAAHGPLPASPTPNARRDDNGNPRDEFFETLLDRQLTAALADPSQHVFAVSYFTHDVLRGAIENLRKPDPVLMARFQTHPALLARFRAERIFQKGIEVAVWEFVPTAPAPATSPTTRTTPAAAATQSP